MAFGETEQPKKIFCLFHQKNDCLCLSPVTDDKTLIARLEHQIKLGNILIKNISNPEHQSKIEAETEGFRQRLDKLQNP